jgi:hypothetical protein
MARENQIKISSERLSFYLANFAEIADDPPTRLACLVSLYA